MRMLLFATLIAAPATASETVFDGQIEAAREATQSSRLDGVVTEILFTEGYEVTAGAPLIRLEPEDAQLDLAAAAATLARAEAELTLARQESERAAALALRGVSAEAQVQTTTANLARAEAEVALARVHLDRAALSVDRTVIRSPIDGRLSAPSTSVGAFLEAEAGPPLGRVVALDPVVVSYRVPYATRLATMRDTGAETLEALFERISLTIRLPDGSDYPLTTQPESAGAVIDPADGSLKVRATLPNPDAILRPGMAVEVTSLVTKPETD